MDKGGLSRVVTTVLLILLIIIALMIYWGFLKVEIVSDSEEASNIFSCVQTDIRVLSCEINPGVEAPVGPVNCPDFDGDNNVGVNDQLAFFASWGELGGVCPPLPEECPWDIDNDTLINGLDFSYLFCFWGPIDCSNFESISDQCVSDGDGDGIPTQCDSDDSDDRVCEPFVLNCASGIDMPSDGDTCDDCASGHYNPAADGCGDNIVRVEFKRNVGGGDLDGAKFVFGYDSGEKIIVDYDSDIEELERLSNDTHIASVLSGNLPANVDVAPVLDNGYLCPQKKLDVKCI